MHYLVQLRMCFVLLQHLDRLKSPSTHLKGQVRCHGMHKTIPPSLHTQQTIFSPGCLALGAGASVVVVPAFAFASRLSKLTSSSDFLAASRSSNARRLRSEFCEVDLRPFVGAPNGHGRDKPAVLAPPLPYAQARRELV